MADRPPRQGWRVPQRMPALAALGLLALIVALLLVAGHAYERTLGARQHRPVTVFPAPGIETYVHAGRGDPLLPSSTVAPDPAIEAAKRAVVAEGLPGWPPR